MYACQCVRECAYLCCQAVPASAGQRGLRNNENKWNPWVARPSPNYKRCFFCRRVLKIGCALLLLKVGTFFECNKNQYKSRKWRRKKRCFTHCISASNGVKTHLFRPTTPHNITYIWRFCLCCAFYFVHVLFSSLCEKQNKMENRIRRVHI